MRAKALKKECNGCKDVQREEGEMVKCAGHKIEHSFVHWGRFCILVLFENVV